MIRLYRAISQDEKDDYDSVQRFRTHKNTLEAKQFFKSRAAVNQFVERSVIQGYFPPYLHLMMISLYEDCLDSSKPTLMTLDGFNAVNIAHNDLLTFNNCFIFVKQEIL